MHTRLKTKYIKSPSADNNLAYRTQRNYCTKLLRKRKCEYYGDLDTKLITDNKTFWNTVKPLFSNKMNTSHKITLINENKISSKHSEIAEICNEYFSTVATKLVIEENDSYICDTRDINDPILAAIKKYEKHPSIFKIAENIVTNEVFKLSPVSCKDVVKSLDISKATTSRNIPRKVFKQNFDICATWFHDSGGT